MGDKEIIEKNVFLKVNGKSFLCECGCNVFHKHSETEYHCNSCNKQYYGEPKTN